MPATPKEGVAGILHDTTVSYIASKCRFFICTLLVAKSALSRTKNRVSLFISSGIANVMLTEVKEAVFLGITIPP